MEALTLIREAGRGFEGFIREFSSGIFALLGIFLGSWLTRRSEFMRIRVERRTQIFDEACKLTAEHSLSIALLVRPASTFGVDEFMRSIIALDWKIKTHFSTDAYKAWRESEKMISANSSARRYTQQDFSEATRKALNALGAEIK
jgi:hypothetical protein